MQRKKLNRWVMLMSTLLLFVMALSISQSSPAHAQEDKIEPGLREAIENAPNGKGEFLVYMSEQADLGDAFGFEDRDERGEYVYDTLFNKAQSTQTDLLAYLNQQQSFDDVTEYRSFYIVNAVAVTGNVETLDALAARPDVSYIEGVKEYSIPEPIPGDEMGINALEWGVAKIRADEVWADFGTKGEGIVVANIDTGVLHTHAALVNQYRGTTTGSHDYNWYDPSGIYPSQPGDNNGHGTHTMGTIAGDDGGSNQIGVAPGAKWIAAKGCASSSCSSAHLLAAAEWVLAPYAIGGTPAQGDSSKRPHLVNNSWGGGGGNTWYQPSVQAWRAAGILPVFSAGNSGPIPGNIGSPADYAESFAVGATDSSDNIASFSSFGPSSLTGETKPDVSAPGVSVRSAWNNGAYHSINGTSMAAPHVAGCAALLKSLDPSLTIEQIENLLTSTAVDLGASGPDYTFGYGRIDCRAAAEAIDGGGGGGDPDIEVDPENISVTLGENSSSSETLTISNVGGGNLIWNIEESLSSLDQSDLIEIVPLGNVPTKSIESNVDDETTGQPYEQSAHTELSPILGISSGGNVLWDLTHGVTGNYQPSGSYSSLVSLLNNSGFTIATTDVGLNNVDLSDYQIVVVNLGSAWNSVYTSSEVSAIEAFVQNGGGLLILGDNANTPNANINPVAQAFGTTVGVSYLSPNDLYITNLDNHPIFNGVSEIYYRAAGEVTGSSPSELVAFDPSNKGAVTAAEVGAGRVVVLGDINGFDNTYIPNSDNQLFAENTFNWLSTSSSSCTPSDISWATLSPTSGTTGAGAADDVTVTLNSTGLAVGTYTGQLCVNSNDPDEPTVEVPVELTVTGETPACDGTTTDLATPNFYGVFDGGEGSGRAIGFQADSDLTINSVGIMGDLVEKSHEIVIYDSPDGHSAGSILYTTSHTIGGTGYGWNDIPVSFTFTAGNFYVVNWRPTDGGNWANQLEYYHDDGLPFTVGPLTLLEGIEGYDAQNTGNYVHPHLRICIDGGGDPDIEVNPDYFDVTLPAGDQTTETLTISNVGGSDLTFDIAVNTSAVMATDVAGDWLNQVSHSPYNSDTGFAVEFSFGDFDIASDAANIAVFGGSASIASFLQGAGHNAVMVSESDILAGVLSDYDLLVMAHLGNSASIVQTEVEEFVSAGGGLVTEWNGSTVLFSSIGANPYGVVEPQWNWYAGEIDYGSYVGTGTPVDIIDVAHPLAFNLPDPFSAGGATEFFYTLLGYTSELDVVAQYTGHGGTWPALMTGSYGTGSVVIQLFDSGDDLSYAEIQQLWLNSINVALEGSSSSWLSASPTTGTVAAGDSTDIDVGFDATNLTEGVYNGSLTINNNDPDENPTTVPVTLTVGMVDDGEFTRTLESGWNLVSFPVEVDDTDVEDVLASIDGQYDIVYAYDGCGAGWKKFDPNGPPFANTLTDLDHSIGFWVNMTQAATLVVTGSTPDSTTMPVCTGWNLVGYPTPETRDLPDALDSISGEYALVNAYKPPWQKFDPNGPPFANTLTDMEAGFGYWINATQDGEVIIE